MGWASIPAMVRDATARHTDREAVVDAGPDGAGERRTWSFADLQEEVDRAARAVIAAGIEPGDRVGIWAPNCAEWIVAALGTLAAGGVLVPLNTRYKGREAAYILETSGARLLFTVTGFLGTDYPGLLAQAGADLPALERTVLLRTGDGGAGGPAGSGADAGAVAGEDWAGFLAAGEELDPEQVAEREAAIAPDDLCDLMFTSGTTGRPKGVMSTHGQTLRVFETWSDHVGLRAGDRYLIVNPFFHTFGYKAGILAAIIRGATILPHAVFDAGSVLERIAAERVTVLPGPPTLYQSLLDHEGLEAADRSSLRLAVTGAAVIPVQLIHRMATDLGFDTVLTAYGLTEATGVVTMCQPGDDPETIATTSGCAIPDTEVRVVDDDGVEVPRGEPGEVVVRGYNVMRGYHGGPDQTAETIDAEGWLRTGDIGVMDERGYLRITDRKKDVFIVGGFNAYPAEIENDLLDRPDIAQVAVVGAPDDRLGEVGHAFVVPRAGTQLDPEEVIAWARERMANFKVPRRVEVVDALPTNASGKVLKHELRARVAGRVDA